MKKGKLNQMNDDKKDVFAEALSKAASAALQVNKPVLDEHEVLPQIKERLAAGETQWDLLKKMIDGSLTERFIEVISAMPDKDFARNYLKLLEHFKPKVTRTEIEQTEKK